MTAIGAGNDLTGAAERSERERRSERVRAMFSDIAPTYDLLNSMLSLGVDGRWRERAAELALAPGREAPRVLDVATGTGNLAFAVKRRRSGSRVTGVDFAPPMLEVARQKAAKGGIDVEFAVADGTALPFPDASFDAVTIGYGLRNFADVDAGLREFRRVLAPGGACVVLEFPPPPGGPFGAVFSFYFRRLLPLIGGAVSGKRSAYAYLPASVSGFLPPAELAAKMAGAGFDHVRYELLTFGVSAVHVGTVADAPARQASEASA